jgi:Uma2 family endonuclease
MSLRKPETRLSVAEYLEGEKDSPVRHEYVEGYVYAMAGASDRHNRISLNIASRLNDLLGEGPCEVFMADMKVMASPEIYYYPDVMVSCDPPGGDAYSRAQPVLLIEVTSPNTHRADHHEKLLAYKRIASLREYALIAQDQMLVEVHRRQEGDHWDQEVLNQPDEQLRFESVGLNLSLAEVYRNVRFAEPA